MASELYEILNLQPKASEADIRKAYRSLAKKHHPDLNPGDKKSAETFRNLRSAYDILSDPEKRRQYDAGEIDAQGNEKQRQFYNDYATSDHPYGSSAGYDDISDLFSDLLRAQQNAGQGRRRSPMGNDLHYQMDISFSEAATGAKKRIHLPDGGTLDVKIPPGHRDGQQLRLKGKGGAAAGGAANGDAYIKIQVALDPVFQRRDRDIVMELDVSLNEAVLGGRVPVPTVYGVVSMTLPPGSNSGDTLRLKGKGIVGSGKQMNGDQLVKLRVVLPKSIDDDLQGFITDWAKDHAYDPRQASPGGQDNGQ